MRSAYLCGRDLHVIIACIGSRCSGCKYICFDNKRYYYKYRIKLGWHRHVNVPSNEQPVLKLDENIQKQFPAGLPHLFYAAVS